jgi:hypothetical protein
MANKVNVRTRLCELLRTPLDSQLHRVLSSRLAADLSTMVVDYAHEHTVILMQRHVVNPGDTFLTIQELSACLQLLNDDRSWDRTVLWKDILCYAKHVFAGWPDVEDWPIYMRRYAKDLIERREGYYSPSDWCFLDRIDYMERRQTCCVHCAVSHADLQSLVEDGQDAIDILTRVADNWSTTTAWTDPSRAIWAEYLIGSHSMRRDFELGHKLCQAGWDRWWRFALINLLMLACASWLITR